MEDRGDVIDEDRGVDLDAEPQRPRARRTRTAHGKAEEAVEPKGHRDRESQVRRADAFLGRASGSASSLAENAVQGRAGAGRSKADALASEARARTAGAVQELPGGGDVDHLLEEQQIRERRLLAGTGGAALLSP